MRINYRIFGLKRLDIYIIKKFLGTYFFSLVLILSIGIVFDLNEKLDRFVENNAPLQAIIFDYYLSFIPYYMNLFSSLFTFIAVIFFTSKIAGNSEIIAILASGVSFHRMMLPYFISAFIIFSISFGLGGYVIPNSTKKMIEFEEQFVRSHRRENVRNIQMEIEPGIILYIDRYEQRQNRGQRFSLEKFDGKHLVSRLTAETITWDSDYNWTVHNFLKRDFDGLFERITYGESLDTIIRIQPHEFFITARDAPQMTNPQLRNHLRTQSRRGVGNIQAFEDEYYRRYSMPIAAFIMTLMGVSLSSRKVRGGMGINLGIGLALSALFILFTTMSTSFAVNGTMSAATAVWLPNIVFLTIGIFLYLRAPK